MIEMVHKLTKLQKLLRAQTGSQLPLRNKALENTIEAIKARATAVTVGDLIKH
jgi:hypothetical protein